MKLKPCPFCGGEKIETVEFEVAGTDSTYVVCVNCGSCTKLHYQKEQAIKAWNRREPMDRIVEQLEAEEYDVNCNICDYDSEIDTNTLQYYEGKEDGIKSAIEILKGGNV